MQRLTQNLVPGSLFVLVPLGVVILANLYIAVGDANVEHEHHCYDHHKCLNEQWSRVALAKPVQKI